MKAIILAAGKGTRLAPLTDTVPKCMVGYNGKAMIDFILDTLTSCGIQDVCLVGGYKMDVLKQHLSGKKIKYYCNEKFALTNMVYSLFCAEEEMNDDIIISYSDIIYEKKVLEKLIADRSPVAVVVDSKWKNLWTIRMDDPLSDAETLVLDSNNNILELGKKADSYQKIQGQYIGLIKFSKNSIKQIVEYYRNLDKNAVYDAKDFDNMFMTSFIQKIIDEVMPVKAVLIDGGWIEIDSLGDIKAYNNHKIVIG